MKSRCLSWLFDCHRSHMPFRKLVPPFTLTEYQVKSRHYKWPLLITENLFKKSYQFLKLTHVRICVKDATPLIYPAKCGKL